MGFFFAKPIRLKTISIPEKKTSYYDRNIKVSSEKVSGHMCDIVMEKPGARPPIHSSRHDQWTTTGDTNFLAKNLEDGKVHNTIIRIVFHWWLIFVIKRQCVLVFVGGPNGL
jgi:hypothetical protein